MAGVRRLEREIVVDNNANAEVVHYTDTDQAVEVVDYILGIVEIALSLRFLFKLFGANPVSGFASFVYAITDPLIAPFRAIFHTVTQQGATFEWSTLVAMAVYALVAWAIIRLIEIATVPRTA